MLSWPGTVTNFVVTHDRLLKSFGKLLVSAVSDSNVFHTSVTLDRY